MVQAQGMGVPQSPMIPAFKDQPWILFDTVASYDYRIGALTPAIGSNAAAFNAQGEAVFFDVMGRNRANFPQLTNMDQPGSMAFGMDIHAIALELKFPQQNLNQDIGNALGPLGPGPTQKIAEAILNFGVLSMLVGQEEQMEWPVSSFTCGGALWTATNVMASAQNGLPVATALLRLSDEDGDGAIAIGRTQNLSVKLRLSPLVFAQLGQGAVAGYGMPLAPYDLSTPSLTDPEASVLTPLPELPYAMTCKLLGKREKFTQYGARTR